MAILAPGASAAVTSSFDSGDDGWLLVDPPSGPPTFSPSGGDPGGFISFTGNRILRSPASWAGDQSDTYAGRLSMDVIHTGPIQAEFPSRQLLVGISGAGNRLGGVVANFSTDSPGWSNVGVILSADAEDLFVFQGGEGTGASEQAVRATLAGLESVTLSANNDPGQVTSLDNIQLAPPTPVERKLTLKRKGSSLVGKLVSPATPFDPACAGAPTAQTECYPCSVETVELYRKKAGPDAFVDDDSTENSSSFSVKLKPKGEGRFYAVAGQAFAGGLDCEAAKSKKVKVG